MSSKTIYGVATLSVTALGLSACSPAEQAASSEQAERSESVVIQIDGAAVPYYAPLYEAEEQGFFEDEGLNVDFTYAEGADILQNVAAGNVDFGFPNGDSVVTAKGSGVDVDVVHTTYQEGIGAVLFNEDETDISSPADLEGKEVAVTDLGSPNYVQLQVMLDSVGMTVDDIDVTTVGSGAIVPALQNGEVDAIAFSRIRYHALDAAGFPVGQILSEEYLPSFGNVLVTSPEYREDNSDNVEGFVRALNRGIEHVIADPATSVEEVIPAYADSFEGEEEEVTEVIESVFIPDLWTSDATEEHGLGYGDLEEWQELIDVQDEYDIINDAFDASELVVNSAD